MSMSLGQTMPTTRCKRCKHAYQAHAAPDYACPDGTGRVWLKKSDRGRASASFSLNEVAVLNDLLLGVTQRKDLSQLARRFEFADIARKVKKLADTSKQTLGRGLHRTQPRDVERAVVRATAGRVGHFTVNMLATETGKNKHSVSCALQRLKSRGIMRMVKHGVWTRVALTNVTPIDAARKAGAR